LHATDREEKETGDGSFYAIGTSIPIITTELSDNFLSLSIGTLSKANIQKFIKLLHCHRLYWNYNMHEA
jgi:hypothetical protein